MYIIITDGPKGQKPSVHLPHLIIILNYRNLFVNGHMMDLLRIFCDWKDLIAVLL